MDLGPTMRPDCSNHEPAVSEHLVSRYWRNVGRVLLRAAEKREGLVVAILLADAGGVLLVHPAAGWRVSDDSGLLVRRSASPSGCSAPHIFARRGLWHRRHAKRRA